MTPGEDVAQLGPQLLRVEFVEMRKNETPSHHLATDA